MNLGLRVLIAGGVAFGALIGGVATLRIFLIGAVSIPSESNLPTLEPGDRLVYNKLAYDADQGPARGDIVVFLPPPRAVSAGNLFIQRVIGLPGETVGFKDGRYLIDGKPLQEPYTLEPARYQPPVWEHLDMPGGRVPAGHAFLLGDNRNNSQDSHVFGPVPLANLHGRVVYRYAPSERVRAF